MAENRDTPILDAVRAVFVDRLGWQPGPEASNVLARGREWSVRLGGPLDACSLVLEPAPRGWSLTALIEGRALRLGLPPAPQAWPNRLAALQIPRVVAEGEVLDAVLLGRIRGLFDAGAIATRFVGEFVALIDAHEEAVVALPRGRLGQTKAIPERSGRTQLVTRFLVRALMVAYLEAGGFMPGEHPDGYLRAYYEAWRADPRGFGFHQRLAMLFHAGLESPHTASRRAAGLPEDLPYLGSGVFSPEDFESEVDLPEGIAVLPDALIEATVGPSGLLTRYPFSLHEPGPERSDVAITPDALGLGLDRLRGRNPSAHQVAQVRREARGRLAALLESDAAWLEPGAPVPASALPRMHRRLNTLRAFDPQCGFGSLMVAYLHELVAVRSKISIARGETAPSAATLARQVAGAHLLGLDPDGLCVLVTRLRLALAVLAYDVPPEIAPLPDLRQVVQRGVTLAPDPERPTTENHRNEFKATFDWDSAKGTRNGHNRRACLQTIAAFANSEGGTLWIGVGVDGTALGIEDELASLGTNQPAQDAFEARLRELLKGSLDPLPLGRVRVSFPVVDGRTLCRVDVDASATITYVLTKDATNGQIQEILPVRDGNRTLLLTGRRRDQFVVNRTLGGG